MTTRLVSREDLKQALPGVRMVVDPDVLSSLAHDDAEWAPVGRPVAAVRATSTTEVQQVVAACARLGIPVVTRGAGTGLSGGANAVDGCLVLDLSTMNRILEIDVDNMVAVVEPVAFGHPNHGRPALSAVRPRRQPGPVRQHRHLGRPG